jgi:hypothetical protein
VPLLITVLLGGCIPTAAKRWVPKDDVGSQEEWRAESAKRGETNLLKYGAEDSMANRNTLLLDMGFRPLTEMDRNQLHKHGKTKLSRGVGRWSPWPCHRCALWMPEWR